MAERIEAPNPMPEDVARAATPARSADGDAQAPHFHAVQRQGSARNSRHVDLRALRPAPAGYRPLVAVAAAVCAGIVLDYVAEPRAVQWLLLAVASLALWGVLFLRRRRRSASLALLLAALGAGGGAHHGRFAIFRADDIAQWATREPTPVHLRGRVIDEPQQFVEDAAPWQTGPSVRTAMTLEVAALRTPQRWQPASGRARVIVYGELPGVHSGDRVRVYGLLSRPVGPGNPGEFDYRTWLRRQRVRALVTTAHSASVIGEPAAGGWTAADVLAALRRRGQAFLWSAMDRDRAGLAAALLLGIREGVDDDLQEQFVQTGSVHLLSISGLHLAILVAFAWFVVRLAGVGGRKAAVAVALLAVGYALLASARPPVVRAAILVSLVAVALAVGRTRLSFNVLAASALVVLALNPTDLFSVGTQLSFLSVAALVRWAPTGRPPTPTLPHKGSGDSNRSLDMLAFEELPAWQRWLRRIAWGGWQIVLMTLVIWAATLPLVVASYHLVSPVGLLLQVPLIPLVGVVLAAGFLALGIGLVVPAVALPLAWVCDGLLSAVEGIVSLGAALPGAFTYVPGPSAWWLVGFYVGLAIFWMSPPSRRARPWAFGACAVWVAIGLSASLLRPVPERLRFTFLSVGHGLAVVVELPDGRVLLYDAGQLHDADRGTDTIAGYLWSRGITHLDAVVLSHADVDHFNALPGLVERFHIGGVFTAPAFLHSGQREAADLATALEARGIPLELCWQGDCLDLGPGLRACVLHPPPQPTADSDNAQSIVVGWEYAGRRVLLTGDLESPGVDRLMATSPGSWDVLMAPHHGSRASNPPGLMEWAEPQWVVVSQGRPRSGPSLEAVPATARVLSTYHAGAVTVTITPDGELRVCAFRVPESANEEMRR